VRRLRRDWKKKGMDGKKQGPLSFHGGSRSKEDLWMSTAIW